MSPNQNRVSLRTFGAALIAIVAFGAMGGPVATPIAFHDGIAVYFSPDGGCTDAIVAQIAGAKKTIRVQAYSFTSAPIAEALVKAHQRGVSHAALYSAPVGDHRKQVIDVHHAIATGWRNIRET